MVSAAEAEVIIKCPKCKSIIDVLFKNNHVKATRV
jgi:phage FluMu protein Com